MIKPSPVLKRFKRRQLLLRKNEQTRGDFDMKSKFLSIAFVVALSAATRIMSGCGGSRVSLVDQGIVSVETKASKNVGILWTDVYQDGEDIIVYGVVQRSSHTSYPIKTHVDVTILSPDGEVLQEVRTPDILVPRRIPGKGINWKRFEVRFPDIPHNSRVQAVAHSGLHEILK
jgi:hypothetical protein